MTNIEASSDTIRSAASAAPGAAAASPAPAVAPDPKAVAQGLFDALNRQDWDALADYLASDVIDHNKVIHDEEDRPGAAFDAFRQQFEAFENGSVCAQQFVAEGDTVAVRLIVRGTHSGAHPRMPEPTGRSFEVEQIWFLTIRNGKVAELRAVSDRLGMFLQLGWDWPTVD